MASIVTSAGSVGVGDVLRSMGVVGLCSVFFGAPALSGFDSEEEEG
jgi:hypothetical protein